MKLTVADYREIIQALKQTANQENTLFIEILANDLMFKHEPEGKNVKTVTKALADELLEGDKILAGRIGRRNFKVRYYCDNLAETRRSYYEVLEK